MQYLIDFPEIHDVIQESGQEIELWTEDLTNLSNENSIYGLPPQKKFICRKLVAYIPDMGNEQFSTGDTTIDFGGHTVWLPADDFQRSEITPNSYIKWSNKIFTITYSDPPIIHRGRIMMHKLTIKEQQSHQVRTTVQPDPIINIS